MCRIVRGNVRVVQERRNGRKKEEDLEEQARAIRQGYLNQQRSEGNLVSKKKERICLLRRVSTGKRAHTDIWRPKGQDMSPTRKTSASKGEEEDSGI